MRVQPCVMAIFAHPDDELDIGGILAGAADEGAQVVLVCATAGDQGGITEPALATRETLAQVRSHELEGSCRRLGIQHLHVGLFGDSGFRTSTAPARSLARARAQDVVARLVPLIRRHRPDAVITYGPDGVYGHRDHTAIGAYATAAFGAAGDRDLYPEPGLAPWQPRRLFYLALPAAQRSVLVHDPAVIQIGEVTHTFEVERYIRAKEEAEQCHRTQSASFPHIAKALSPDEYRRAVGTECLMLAQERPVGALPELPPSGILRRLLAE